MKLTESKKLKRNIMLGVCASCILYFVIVAILSIKTPIEVEAKYVLDSTLWEDGRFAVGKLSPEELAVNKVTPEDLVAIRKSILDRSFGRSRDYQKNREYALKYANCAMSGIEMYDSAGQNLNNGFQYYERESGRIWMLWPLIEDAWKFEYLDANSLPYAAATFRKAMLAGITRDLPTLNAHHITAIARYDETTHLVKLTSTKDYIAILKIQISKDEALSSQSN